MNVERDTLHMERHTMKKRQTRFFPLLLVLALIGAGCDILDNPRPRQSLPVEDLTGDAKGMRALVTGLYDAIQEHDLAGSFYNIAPELMSDNVVYTGSYDNLQNTHQHNMIPQDPATGWWLSSYEAINMANLILDLLEQPEETGLGQAEIDLMRGDALFIRGMLYFELGRVFSKPWWTTGDGSHDGVPLRIRPVTDISHFEHLPRATLAETYQQAREDLVAAAELLPDTGTRQDSPVDPNGRGRATRHAALGYQMRLEMERQRYDVAADLAAEIMGSGHFTLAAHPEDPFRNDFSSEAIFEVIHTATDNPGVNNSISSIYSPPDLGGRGDIRISTSFASALQSVLSQTQRELLQQNDLVAKDLRLELLTTTEPGRGATLKYNDATGNADNVMNLRYPEVLLSRAEALAEMAADLNDLPQEVFDLLNRVRTRSIKVTRTDGGDASDDAVRYRRADFTTKEEVIDAILLERRVELAFEGDRFHTLQRRGLPVRDTPAGDNRLLFPLPQEEVDANPFIEQHGDY